MKKSLITLALVVSCACFAGAEQWKTLGTRPMGMGGAFVAMAQGPMAQYWNPGGLFQLQKKELQYTYATLYEDISFQGFSFAIPRMGNISIGVTGMQLVSTGFIERDTLNQQTGTFSDADTVLGLSGCYELVKDNFDSKDIGKKIRELFIYE